MLWCDGRGICYLPKRLTPSVTISIDGGQPITVTDNIAYGERNEAQANIFGLFSRKPERVEADIYFENSDGDSWTLSFTPFMLPFINAVTHRVEQALRETPVVPKPTLDDILAADAAARAAARGRAFRPP